ncbi:oxidoreductase, aldo/keto reductase family [Sporolactobacillus inulinus]|uniref:Oxidoreductase, aldo/keto reductase family n=1 Tax=Sporolactobacillus inulinus TaxID=2078 RepID=A0A4Y1ZIV0_9BACL|nr:aldo/keto reductase [Sporolactobacillus inulinus]GAY78911.1 oxidoreductase, aldo/keto reductase family [Sporolactobacillus inulinus]
MYQVKDANEATEAVLNAIHAGYRLIDTAASYGNERAVGEAIKRSDVVREGLFITSKLWVQDAGYEKTTQAIKDSLKRLQLNYLDLYLIHQPFNDVFGSWRAMIEAQKTGLIKEIGVSNFSISQLTNLTEFTGVKPSINQIEVNPFNQNNNSVVYFSSYGVQVEAWAPFAEGRNGLFSNETLQKIGDVHHKSIAQVVLRWLIQRGLVVVAKSSQPIRMHQNIDVLDFKLTDAEMTMISELNVGKSQFFAHDDPEIIKWMASRTIDY